MKTRQVALALTWTYWIGVVVCALFAGPLDWYALGVLGFGLFFRVPLTAVVWVIWAVTQYLRIPLTPPVFVLIGVGVLPPINVAWYVHWSHRSLEVREQQAKAEIAATKLEWISDEALSTANGPIGVRFRYRVNYGLGGSTCTSQGVSDNVSAGRPAAWFEMSARIMTPPVSGGCQPGSYEFMVDFLPYFMPRFLVYPNATVDEKSRRCFSWGRGPPRETVLDADAQRLDLAMFIGGATIHRVTQNTYTLRDFYQTALASGAMECP